jgi:hypothetical protein
MNRRKFLRAMGMAAAVSQVPVSHGDTLAEAKKLIITPAHVDEARRVIGSSGPIWPGVYEWFGDKYQEIEKQLGEIK